MSQRAKNRRRVRRWSFTAEILEERMLLAVTAQTFNAPSLSGLITQALRGKNTSGQAINLMVGSLQSQLNSGPLADLQSGAVNGNGFIQEVEGLVSSYSQNVDQQLLPRFKNVDTILQLQGQRIVADLVSLNQQETAGLIPSTTQTLSSQGAIGNMTSGPITALNTPLSAYVTATQTFQANANTVVKGLSSSSTTPLTVAQAALTLAAEAEAYRADVHAGTQVTSPRVSAQVDSAVSTLESTIDSVVTSGADASTAQSKLTTALSTFATTVLDTTGIFGPQGPVAPTVSGNGTLPMTTRDVRPSTTITTVSGTESTDGTATLTATLSGANGGTGIAGALIDFTLNGAFAGIAVTDASGVATLSSVHVPAGAVTSTSGVAAAFLGNSSDRPSNGSGNFTATAQPTALGSVSGTASFGGTATLTATLTSTGTGKGLAGKTVDFTLDGASVGSGVTDSNGIATLTGVATSDAVGTHTGVVAASFAGDSTDQAANATGNLVVSQTGTTLTSVAGTATFGGKATLTATLTSSATGKPISGQTVNFTLDGTSVGTAVTNSSGVATLTNVTTTDAVGTHTSAVVALFSGSTDYQAAANATGNLVVSQAATTLSSVSGTASSTANPEQATLTATLKSSATNQGVSGQTVTFTLNGVSVGSAVTNSSGVATLTGVSTNLNAGTHTNAIVASFSGSTNYASAANVNGDLVVSPAPTALSATGATAAFGGKATLTATLKTSDTSTPLAGKTVSFTLDNTAVGTAVTNSSGVATLTNVATTDSAGTHTGAVVASFTGDSTYAAAANATGDLVVTQAATTLSDVSGTASSTANPEQATLLATLKSNVTGQGVPGETVSFTLDGTSVGTAVTDASGEATLPGVATSDPAGTHQGVVVAKYTGSTNYAAATNASGNLVVS